MTLEKDLAQGRLRTSALRGESRPTHGERIGIQPRPPAEGKGGFCRPLASLRRICRALAKPLHAVCQSLAILALVCQTLATTSGCTSYSAAMADLGAASRAAIETTPGFDTLPEICE